MQALKRWFTRQREHVGLWVENKEESMQWREREQLQREQVRGQVAQ